MGESFLVPRSDPTIRTTRHRAELGELSVSEPQPIDPELIQSATNPLPWEVAADTIDTAWHSGSTWYQTRVKLVNLWVLPRDMSNGAWEAYSVAASKGEARVLNKAPQLLRLPTDQVVASARTVLNDLGLPPAVLRNEPILLTIPSERLLQAFAQLMEEQDKPREELRTICQDNPDLLIATASTLKLSP